MAQESFYGGRQGASFVIVKQYTSIAEMVIEFGQGGGSIGQVNYGEYVIIDSLDKNSLENGCVYCRKMTYNEEGIEKPSIDPTADLTEEQKEIYRNYIKNPGHGAEYIGQICGPDGKVQSVEITYYDDPIFNNPSKNVGDGSWSVDENTGLVPGKTENNFNDNIDYRQSNLIDSKGNIIKYLIGFKIPFLVTYFDSKRRSAYYTAEDGVDPSLVGTPIQDSFNLLIDNEESTEDRDPTHGDTGHPFYRKYKISIPKGIKGDVADNVKIYPFKIKAGSSVYNSKTSSSSSIVIAEDTSIIVASYYDDYDDTYKRVRIIYNGNIYQARIQDGKDYHYGYLQTNYDNNVNGQHIQIDIGPYRTIDNIELSADGYLTVNYTCENADTLSQALRWIYLEDNNTKGIQMDDDGSVTVWYNTLDNNFQHEHQTYSNLLTWITKISLLNNGEFKVYFNNDMPKDAIEAEGGEQDDENHAYITNLKQVKDISVENNGDLIITYNDDSTFTFEKKVKQINDISIDTGVQEGQGDQKIYVTYNNSNVPVAIGKPINYIVETLVSKKGDEYNIRDIDASHLLVYYSDPAYREFLVENYPERIYSYKSLKDQTIRNDWFDLGYVKGEPGGIHIIGNVSTVDDLYQGGVPIKPEDFGGSSEFKGWAMTVGDALDPDSVLSIYTFDYLANRWNSLGPISSASTMPEVVIQISREDEEPISLNPRGIWLVSKTRVSV